MAREPFHCVRLVSHPECFLTVCKTLSHQAQPPKHSRTLRGRRRLQTCQPADAQRSSRHTGHSLYAGNVAWRVAGALGSGIHRPFPRPPAISPPLPSADLTRPEPSALPSPPTNFGFYGHYKVLCTAFQRKGRRWPDLITLRHCFEIQHILMFSWAIFLNSYLPQVFLLFKILLLMQIKKKCSKFEV